MVPVSLSYEVVAGLSFIASFGDRIGKTVRPGEVPPRLPTGRHFFWFLFKIWEDLALAIVLLVFVLGCPSACHLIQHRFFILFPVLVAGFCTWLRTQLRSCFEFLSVIIFFDVLMRSSLSGLWYIWLHGSFFCRLEQTAIKNFHHCLQQIFMTPDIFLDTTRHRLLPTMALLAAHVL